MTTILRFDSRSVISGSNVAVNTWHIRCGGPVTTAEAQALMVPFKTFYDAIASSRNTVAQFVTGNRVVQFDTTTWVPPTFKPPPLNHVVDVPGHFTTPPAILPVIPNTSVVGTGSSATPAQLAIVISWRTAFASRRSRGRTYLGQIGTTAISANIVAPSVLATINSSAATLLTNISAVSVSSGVVGLTVWSPTAGVAYDIINGNADNVFDTMRSRVR